VASRDVRAPPWELGACAALYGLGVFLHFAADMQKHTALALRPQALVEDGLFARTPQLPGRAWRATGFRWRSSPYS